MRRPRLPHLALHSPSILPLPADRANYAAGRLEHRHDDLHVRKVVYAGYGKLRASTPLYMVIAGALSACNPLTVSA